MPRRGFTRRNPVPKRDLVSTHTLVTRVAPDFDTSEELQAEWLRIYPAALLLESALQSLFDLHSSEVSDYPHSSLSLLANHRLTLVQQRLLDCRCAGTCPMELDAQAGASQLPAPTWTVTTQLHTLSQLLAVTQGLESPRHEQDAQGKGQQLKQWGK